MDIKLVSMKLDKKDVEKMYEPTEAAKDAPRYPWGLALNLDDEALGRLGLKDLPDVDTELVLAARVNVTRASSSSTIGDKKRRSLELQITEMGIGDEPKKTDAAEKLYDGGKK